MTARSLLLVSPREPSGATWLINCLLELGVHVYRKSNAPMWQRTADGWVLSPHEEILKKWLPSLSLRERFRFREDIEVRWTHEWPGAESASREVLLFVRDPRDALWSRFKREASALSFAEFLAFPDPYTLLDKVDHWLLLVRCWLSHGAVRVLRFEDYKRDAAATLSQALQFVGIAPSAADFARAVEGSTFDEAAKGERAYRAAHPEDRELINRQGAPGEWRGLPQFEADMREIEQRCGGLLRDLGYSPAPALPAREAGFLAHAALLSFFERVPEMPLQQAGSGLGDAARIGRTLSFALNANRDLVTRAALPAHERAALAASLDEYLSKLGYGALRNLRDIGLGHATFDWKSPLAPARAMVRRLRQRRG